MVAPRRPAYGNVDVRNLTPHPGIPAPTGEFIRIIVEEIGRVVENVRLKWDPKILEAHRDVTLATRNPYGVVGDLHIVNYVKSRFGVRPRAVDVPNDDPP